MSHNEVNEISGVAALEKGRSTFIWTAQERRRDEYIYSAGRASFHQIQRWRSRVSSIPATTYDAWNRLAEVEAGMTTVAAYHYDGLRRRIRVDACYC